MSVLISPLDKLDKLGHQCLDMLQDISVLSTEYIVPILINTLPYPAKNHVRTTLKQDKLRNQPCFESDPRKPQTRSRSTGYDEITVHIGTDVSFVPALAVGTYNGVSLGHSMSLKTGLSLGVLRVNAGK